VLRRVLSTPRNLLSDLVLVTGGGGYIGSVLVPTLLAEGFRVRVLDTFRHRQPSLLAHCLDPNLEICRADCRTEAAVHEAVQGVDWIIPLAALVGAPACAADPLAATTTNVDAVRLLLRRRTASQGILFPVTNSGYGIGENGSLCTEESPLRPLSLYGRTKVEAEKAVLDAGNALTFRLATAFGAAPRMRLDLLVNDFTYRAVKDRVVVLFEAHFKRNYIHVRDIARAFVHGIRTFETMKGRPYNVGLSDANLSKLELCHVIKSIVPAFQFMEAPVGEDPDKRDYIVSNARLEATGFRPAFGLADGIRELVKAYLMLPASEFTNL
jgi:nucleoside-diphosphate-sugar epimerase